MRWLVVRVGCGSQDKKTRGREIESNIRRLISTRYRLDRHKENTFALCVEVGKLGSSSGLLSWDHQFYDSRAITEILTPPKIAS